MKKMPIDLALGGEKLVRDKNSHDYLETIRENEQLHIKGSNSKNDLGYNEDSYSTANNSVQEVLQENKSKLQGSLQ